jgi:integrase
MARDRSKENQRLPPYVYPRKERNYYFYKPYKGTDGKGKPKFGAPIRLCSMDANVSEVWQAYESLQTNENNTLRWLLKTYNESDSNKSNVTSVQRQHEMYFNKLVHAVGKNGTKFGDLALENVNRLMIRAYLDKAVHKVGANRHIQYLKSAWNWARQRYAQVPQDNPCEMVTLNEEKSRERYVEDWEFYLVQEIIHKTTRSPYLAVMMEFAYLCRLRNSEVRQLKHSDIKNNQIRIKRGKGSLGELTRISPRLQEAIDSAKAINPNAPTLGDGAFLLHDAKGLKVSKNRFDSAWQRVMDKAVNEGIEIDGQQLNLDEPFTFHDLKAKGTTDHTEQWAGHKSEKARQVYIRKLREIDATR